MDIKLSLKDTSKLNNQPFIYLIIPLFMPKVKKKELDLEQSSRYFLANNKV
jgi:hypothetical protein